MAVKTGAASLTLLAKHICHLLTTWRPAINGVIAAAVAASVITPAQSVTLTAWLDGASAACDILRVITGY